MIYILLFTQTSCNFIEEKISEKQLLEKQLKAINWQKVDKFPSLKVCEVLQNESEQKKCLIDYINQTISEKLNLEINKKWPTKTDSLTVKVTISKKGEIDFSAIDKIDKDSIVKTISHRFPRVTPATKQGLLVDTQFNIKVIYKSN